MHCANYGILFIAALHAEHKSFKLEKSCDTKVKVLSAIHFSYTFATNHLNEVHPLQLGWDAIETRLRLERNKLLGLFYFHLQMLYAGRLIDSSFVRKILKTQFAKPITYIN